jgi:methionyl-tRNA formyltransferase
MIVSARPRAIFFGTPEIAVPALRALAELAEVTAVVCQPDRPAGRGLALRPPAVKVAASELGLSVVQPTRIKGDDFAAFVREQSAEIALVMAYGRILPPAVLGAPRLGCVNLHASILPRYRGAAPINWAIVSGETETGISLMQMDAGCDTGPVFAIHRLPIGPDETAGELYARLAVLGATVVVSELPRLLAGELSAIPQDGGAATHAPMLSRNDGRIDWTAPADRVHDLVRGMTPWPGATTMLDDERFKILVSRRGDDESHAPPGTIVALDDAAVVACGHGTLRILRGQLEGKKALSARDLANGRRLAVGMRFA